MAYATDKKPGELTALTSLATDDVFVVGDTSDTSEVAKYITKANLITDLTANFATALGADDNYVTDAEKIKLSNLSGTNTGDQTSIVGITGTIDQFNTALSDGNFATLTGAESLTNKKLGSLTSNGFVKTSGGDGTLSVDTSTYLTATSISDTAYGAGWNADTTTAPSKNAVYDEMELRAPKASPTFTGTVTLPKTTEIHDTTGDHQYVLAVSELTADRTVTLPLLTGNDEFVFKDHTQTFTNKRITQRRGSTTSSATPTINTDDVDIYSLTAQTADITSFTTNLSGTPTHGQKLLIEITGTAARAITWGASFEASTIALPTTTVSTNMLQVAFIWNSATSKWRCVGSV